MDSECVREKKINTYKSMVRKRESRKVLGIPRSILEDIIKMELNELRWEGPEWKRLGQYRDKGTAVVNTVMDPRVP
jgi:hypothetical protein